MLSRNDLLTALSADSTEETYPLKGIGDVGLRRLSPKTCVEASEQIEAGNPMWPIMTRCLVEGVVDDKGEPLFTGEDDELLTELGFPRLHKVFKRLAAFSGISEEVDPKTVKNSEKAPSDS